MLRRDISFALLIDRGHKQILTFLNIQAPASFKPTRGGKGKSNCPSRAFKTYVRPFRPNIQFKRTLHIKVTTYVSMAPFIWYITMPEQTNLKPFVSRLGHSFHIYIYIFDLVHGPNN